MKGSKFDIGSSGACLRFDLRLLCVHCLFDFNCDFGLVRRAISHGGAVDVKSMAGCERVRKREGEGNVARAVFESDSLQHLSEQAGLNRSLFLLLQVRRVMLWKRWKETNCCQWSSFCFGLDMYIALLSCSRPVAVDVGMPSYCSAFFLSSWFGVQVFVPTSRSANIPSQPCSPPATCLFPYPFPFSFFAVFLRLLDGGTYRSIAHSMAPYANTSGGSQYRI